MQEVMGSFLEGTNYDTLAIMVRSATEPYAIVDKAREALGLSAPAADEDETQA